MKRIIYFWSQMCQEVRPSINGKHLILTNMKKEYLEPEVRIAQIGFEVNFLTSEITLGGLGGEDLDNPDDPFDPWS